MAEVVLGVAGAAVGAAFGNVQLGWALGTTLAGVMYPARGRAQERGKLDDIRVGASAYDAFIPQVYGDGRVAGNLLWESPVKETISTTRSGGKGGGARTTEKSYHYKGDVLIGICAAPVAGIGRIWADGQIVYDPAKTPASKYDIEILLGAETQLPHSRIEAVLGVGNVPAYRGWVCALWKDIDRNEFGGRFASTEYETVPRGAATDDAATDATLKLWFRADAGLTTFLDGNGELRVTRWADQKGTGVDLDTVGPPYDWPVKSPSEAQVFFRNDHYLNTSGGLPIGTPVHFFGVLSADAANWNAGQSILDGTTDFGMRLQRGPTVNQVAISSATATITAGGFNPGSRNLVEFFINGASSYISVNRGANVTGNLGSTPSPGGLYIGNAASNASIVRAWELRPYQGQKTGADRQKILDQLGSRWGV